ncbi:hypothetical protein H4R33_007147, partial [Dimargaris cristalligena]
SKSYPQMKVKRSMASILCSAADETPVHNQPFTRDQFAILIHNSTTHRRGNRRPANPHCLANLGSSSPPTASDFLLPAADLPSSSPGYDNRGGCLLARHPHYCHSSHQPEDHLHVHLLARRNNDQHLNLKLRTIRYTDYASVEDYIYAFLALWWELDVKPTPNASVKLFRIGLGQADLATRVSYFKPQTLREAIDIARLQSL